jgi:hypothetical protein
VAEDGLARHGGNLRTEANGHTGDGGAGLTCGAFMFLSFCIWRTQFFLFRNCRCILVLSPILRFHAAYRGVASERVPAFFLPFLRLIILFKLLLARSACAFCLSFCGRQEDRVHADAG